MERPFLTRGGGCAADDRVGGCRLLRVVCPRSARGGRSCPHTGIASVSGRFRNFEFESVLSGVMLHHRNHTFFYFQALAELRPECQGKTAGLPDAALIASQHLVDRAWVRLRPSFEHIWRGYPLPSKCPCPSVAS